MKKKVLMFGVLMLGLFQIAFGQTDGTISTKTVSQAVPPEIQRAGYLVGPGDVIIGKVLSEPQFDFVATIDEDGKFQLPFFEKPVMAKCRTERELRSDVSQLLAKYLKNPLVGISIERKSRPPATIYGEVRNPQQVVMTRKVRLLDLLAFAGGVNTEKAGGAIQIFHTQPPMCEETYEDGTGNAEIGNDFGFPFRVYSLNTVQLGSNAANPIIYPGDIIVVKEALPVYIVGEVNATGKILLPEGGLTLSQAVASVGGIRPGAKTKDIKIYRLKADSKDREIISANYDFIRKGKQKDVLLSPYDIVEIGKAKQTIAQTLLEIAIGAGRTAANTLPVRVL